MRSLEEENTARRSHATALYYVAALYSLHMTLHCICRCKCATAYASALHMPLRHCICHCTTLHYTALHCTMPLHCTMLLHCICHCAALCHYVTAYVIVLCHCHCTHFWLCKVSRRRNKHELLSCKLLQPMGYKRSITRLRPQIKSATHSSPRVAATHSSPRVAARSVQSPSIAVL